MKKSVIVVLVVVLVLVIGFVGVKIYLDKDIDKQKENSRFEENRTSKKNNKSRKNNQNGEINEHKLKGLKRTDSLSNMFNDQEGGMLDYYDLTTQRGKKGKKKINKKYWCGWKAKENQKRES